MDMVSAFLILMASVVAIGFGANWLIESSVFLAQRYHIPKRVIGATLLSFGTTLPEFAVSLNAALAGSPGLALGNAFGSIIFNTGFILSLVCMLTPIHASFRNLRHQFIFLGLAMLAVLAFAKNDMIAPIEGGALLSLTIAYCWILYRKTDAEDVSDQAGSHSTSGEKAPHPDGNQRALGVQALFFLLGIALVGFGSKFMVSSATTIARGFGVSETIIGLTIVAAGTSMPELVTSVMSVLKGHRDLSLGNILGANILNITWVTAFVAVSSGTGLTTHGIFKDMLVAGAINLYPLIIILFYRRLGWAYGAVGMVGYIIYAASKV